MNQALTKEAIKALQSPTSHRIARRVQERPTTLLSLQKNLDIPWHSIFRSLENLERAGIIQGHGERGEKVYALAPGVIVPRFPFPGGTRLEVSRLVCAHPESIPLGKIVEHFALDVKVAQHHIRVLAEADLFSINLTPEGETYASTPQLVDLLNLLKEGET